MSVSLSVCMPLTLIPPLPHLCTSPLLSLITTLSSPGSEIWLLLHYTSKEEGSGHSNQEADVYFRQLNGIVFFKERARATIFLLSVPLFTCPISFIKENCGEMLVVREKRYSLSFSSCSFSLVSLSLSRSLFSICLWLAFLRRGEEDLRIYYNTLFKAKKKNQESDCLSADRKKKEELVRSRYPLLKELSSLSPSP